MTKPATRQIDLPLNLQLLPALLDSVMSNFIAAYHFPETVNFGIKWILIELSTNAYKHAVTETTKLYVHITEANITITKTDKGDPPNFYLLIKQLHGKKISIYDCGTNPLFAEQRDDEKIYFYEEFLEAVPEDIQNFAEHFGLLIISRASDTFTFFRDTQQLTNTFTAIINYQA